MIQMKKLLMNQMNLMNLIKKPTVCLIQTAIQQFMAIKILIGINFFIKINSAILIVSRRCNNFFVSSTILIVSNVSN